MQEEGREMYGLEYTGDRSRAEVRMAKDCKKAHSQAQ